MINISTLPITTQILAYFTLGSTSTEHGRVANLPMQQLLVVRLDRIPERNAPQASTKSHVVFIK